jgi:mono/diheme cytochrome c family protein
MQFSRPTSIMLAFVALGASAPAADAPDFQSEVRPILSQYCFKCHGPDDKARKAKLRLDMAEGATKEAKSGSIAVVPGKPDESELVVRIFSTDEDDVMPPPEMKKVLTAQQKEILKRWVAAGAEYKPHWSFAAPKQAPTPAAGHPIDSFVTAKLSAANLRLSPEADRATLLRRVSYDLTGLPPTSKEIDAFLNDLAPGAYERVVDRLLASPQYGERWARKWLDLARYADTNGYEKDRTRNIWPFRDWVVRAINADMPFDEFTVEQLAGDLLPNATRDQLIATGFHRNTMLNEEGGIDPLEFRYHAMTDRVATTGSTWLGLTIGCAQCHTHKYDPITHREYFQIMAFLNNADEPDLDLPPADAEQQIKQRAARAAKLIADLPNRWPVEDAAIHWETPRPLSVKTSSGVEPRILEDQSVLFAMPAPEMETATLVLETKAASIDRIRLEALTDDTLPHKGPGRTGHGNFVLNEITVQIAPLAEPGKQTQTVQIVSAEADAEQDGFPVTSAFDGKKETGWAVEAKGKPLNGPKTAVFKLKEPIQTPNGAQVIVVLDQSYGQQHTIGRARISFGAAATDVKPLTERRKEALEKRFAGWLAEQRATAVQWTPLRPTSATSNLPLLTPQPDGSIFVSGDISKADTYDLKFTGVPAKITAVRLEALPDDRLPAHGPGLTYYEGPKGDFFLGEFQATADGRPVKFVRATESYARNAMGKSNPVSALLAADGDPQTGWSCAERMGEAHEAVFILSEPVAAKELDVKMMFGRHYACSLGRFRISVTTDSREAKASTLPGSLRDLVSIPSPNADQRARLREQFLLSAPELAASTKEVRDLKQMPSWQTTLVMRERPAGNPRPTFIHNRGEFTQPTDKVEPGVLSVLNPLPSDQSRDRLAFARWLVSSENPLTARVVVNRAWAAFFGRGIVKTTDDFGFQGEMPTHPELLDWLAVEFVKQGWSTKKLHRLIVTSATYRQSSKVLSEQTAKDSENKLLSHFPRTRLEAEMIRDGALTAANLLSLKMGGPPVKPPQAEGVSEVAYGNPKWDAATGEDRYRRSLYTFVKRTAPFALYNTFDAPTGEACIVRRDVSNTPLQALTLLNDVIFIESAQALGKQLAGISNSDDDRIREAYRRVLARFPREDELPLIRTFLATQRQRLESGELKAVTLGGPNATKEIAVWSILARALFNLDENVTKG